MPRVPTYDPGQTKTVQTTTARLKAPDNSGGLGVLAEGLAGAAKALSAQDKINFENDETQARVATAQARQQYAGAVDSFKTLQLGQARAGQEGFNTGLDKIKSDVLASASSTRQRQMIERELLEVDGSARRMGASWALSQSREETKASFGIEQTSLIDAAVMSDNPQFRDDAGLKVRDSVRRQMAFDGWDEQANPAAYAVEEKAALTKLHSGVLDRMFSNADPDIDEVGQYLGAYKDEMTGDLYSKTLARMQGPLQDRVDDYRADLIQVAPKEGEPLAGTAPGPWQGVAVNVAKRFGLDPSDMAAVMSYETGGTFSPTIMGGTGGNYMGLIQFGPAERKKYGIDKASTPEKWTAAVGDFLEDRGFKRGMGMLDLYSTINAGSPGRYNASDGNGTVRSHVEQILGAHKEKAKGWLGGAAGYSNAPREWDRPAIYAQIEDKAAAEGWTPEATKRVKRVWDQRMSTDEGLLGEQRRSADDQAKVIALNAGDNFRVSMLPKAVQDNLSPVDRAEYGAAERRIAEQKAKEAETARKEAARETGKSAEWQLEAQARFDPEGFKRADLKKYIGVISGEALNSLATKQVDLIRKPPPKFQPQEAISSAISRGQRYHGVEVDKKDLPAIYDFMQDKLAAVQAKNGGIGPNDADEAFKAATSVAIKRPGMIWGSTERKGYEVTVADIGDGTKDIIRRNWKGSTPPSDDQILDVYRAMVPAKGL
jgi:hypothetical protein